MKTWFSPAFVMLLTILIGGELVVRIFYKEDMQGRFEYGYNPTAGFVEHADGTVNLIRSGGRRFWPQTFSKTRPPGTFRLMVIGDSVPRGSSLATAYAAQIGEQLRAMGIKAESFNLAIGGNGAARSEIILRQALDYQPSLVILHVDNGDEFEDEREFKRAEAFKGWHPRTWLMKSFFIRRLYEVTTEQIFWKLVPAEVRVLNSVNDTGDKVLAGENPATRREWDARVRKYTAESVALARQRGIPILLLTESRLHADGHGGFYLDDRGLDELVRPMLGEGVYFLSMKEFLQKTNFAPLFTADGTHLHPAGHALLAAAVVEKLLQAGVVTGGH